MEAEEVEEVIDSREIWSNTLRTSSPGTYKSYSSSSPDSSHMLEQNKSLASFNVQFYGYFFRQLPINNIHVAKHNPSCTKSVGSGGRLIALVSGRMKEKCDRAGT